MKDQPAKCQWPTRRNGRWLPGQKVGRRAPLKRNMPCLKDVEFKVTTADKSVIFVCGQHVPCACRTSSAKVEWVR